MCVRSLLFHGHELSVKEGLFRVTNYRDGVTSGPNEWVIVEKNMSTLLTPRLPKLPNGSHCWVSVPEYTVILTVLNTKLGGGSFGSEMDAIIQ